MSKQTNQCLGCSIQANHGEGGREKGGGEGSGRGDYQNKQISVWCVPFKPIIRRGGRKVRKGEEGGLSKPANQCLGCSIKANQGQEEEKGKSRRKTCKRLTKNSNLSNICIQF